MIAVPRIVKIEMETRRLPTLAECDPVAGLYCSGKRAQDSVFQKFETLVAFPLILIFYIFYRSIMNKNL